MKNSQIQRSINGALWQQRSVDSVIYNTLRHKFNISDHLARLTASRESVSENNFMYFMNPKLRDLLPDPISLQDMDKATERINSAIQNKEKICIYADYDVDGSCSAALFVKFFKKIGTEVEIYVPDRKTEGYGPNENAFRKIKESGVDLIITVDSGTVAFGPINVANEIGLDVIVVDHHKSSDVLPDAVAIVNPNRSDEHSEDCKNFCATAVTFMVCVALNRLFRESDYYKSRSFDEVNMIEYVDLVALATICDVMKLDCINRAFVKTGLDVIKRGVGNKGIIAILEHVGILKKSGNRLNGQTLGFVLGPIINSGSRMGYSDLAAQLLISNSKVLAKKMSSQLFQLNEDRKKMESNMLKNTIRIVNSSDHESERFVITESDSIDEGVIGIIAAKIKESYSKPALVGSIINNNGVQYVKYSCRSVPGINIGSIVLKGVDSGIIEKGGGHAMAAGFVCEYAKLDEMKKFFANEVPNVEMDNVSSNNEILFFDDYLSLDSLNSDFVKELESLEPFGNSNPEPIFIVRALEITNVRYIGNNHLLITVCCSISKREVQMFSFKNKDTNLGRAIMDLYSKKEKADFLVSASIDSRDVNSNRLSMRIIDCIL